MKAIWVKGFTTFSSHERGFTLIELLIIIAILGILAAGVVTAINPLAKINSANLAKAKTFSASIENNLVMYQVGKWSFDDSSSPGKDTSGYGNNGTINGGAVWQTSSQCGLGFGGCLSFDGVDDYVEVPNVPSLQITDAYTIELWMKINAITSGTYNLMVTKNINYYFRYLSSSRKLELHYYDEDNAAYVPQSVDSFTLNEWTHIAVTFNSATGKVFFSINGVYKEATGATSPAGRKAKTNNEPLQISRYEDAGNTRINGFIDEVRIYNQALLSSRIQQLYAQGLIRHL